MELISSFLKTWGYTGKRNYILDYYISDPYFCLANTANEMAAIRMKDDNAEIADIVDMSIENFKILSLKYDGLRNRLKNIMNDN